MVDFVREKLDSAVIDKEMRNNIERILDSCDESIGYKLNPKNFVVRTAISTLSPLGWVHVYKTVMGKIDCGLRYEKRRRHLNICRKIKDNVHGGNGGWC